MGALGRPRLRRDRSAAATSRTRRRRDMEQSLRRFLELPDPTEVLPGPRPADDGRARARDTTPSCGVRERGAPAAPRHRATCCRRDADAMLGPVRSGAPRRAPCTGSATSRRRRSSTPSCSRGPRASTSDVVTKEMYTFEDKGGRSLTLRPEQHRDARPGVPGERARPADAVQGLLRLAAVPARPAAGRAAPRVPPVRRRDDRRRRAAAPTSRSIALGDRFLRGPRAVASSTLLVNSIGDRGLPPRVPGAAGRAPRAARGRARRGLPDRACARTPCGCSTARSTAGRTSCWTRRDLGSPVRGVRRALRGRASAGSRPRTSRSRTTRGSCGGSTTTRAPRSSSSPARSRRRSRRSAAAAGTTGSPRCSAVRRRPGVGFGARPRPVLLAAMREEGVAPPTGRGARVLRRRDRRRSRPRRRAPRRRSSARGDPGRARVRGPPAQGAAADGRPRRRDLSRGSSATARSRRGS